MRLALIASSLLAAATLPANAALITYTSSFDLADIALQSRARDYTESLGDFRTGTPRGPTPVPEPGTFALVALGLGALALALALQLKRSSAARRSDD